MTIDIGSSEYVEIHRWLKYWYGKANKCEICGDKTGKFRFEWAKKKGVEYVKERDNFIMACRSCHSKMDFTEETRKKLRESHLGQESGRKKKVVQLDKSGKIIAGYESITEGARACGILKSAIINNLTGRYKSAGGFIWQYL